MTRPRCASCNAFLPDRGEHRCRPKDARKNGRNINVAMPRELGAHVRKLAAAANETQASVVRTLIREALEARERTS